VSLQIVLKVLRTNLPFKLTITTQNATKGHCQKLTTTTTITTIIINITIIVLVASPKLVARLPDPLAISGAGEVAPDWVEGLHCQEVHVIGLERRGDAAVLKRCTFVVE
jgi:hypothetical protein